MNVSIISAGSRGDVQPYVALGVGLHRAGHDVRFVTPADYKGLIEDHGLDFRDLGGNMQSVAQSLDGQLEGGNMFRILLEMGPAAKRLVSEAAEKGLEASRGSDLIIAGLGGLFIGLAISEKLCIPFVPAFLYPFTPTSEFPSVLFPFQSSNLPGWVKKVSHQMAQQMMWQTFRSADNKARREVLHLNPTSIWGPFSTLHRNKQPVVYGYSKHVIPFPDDWDDSVVVTGYWFLEPSKEWKPSIELMQFLESGPPPVYIGFGSMVNRKPEEVTNLVIEALGRIGQRGILSSGWGGLEAHDLPETVFVTGSIPHTWLFPRTTAVVHHGGVGTTAAGLRAGVPSIVTPYFGDQPFWGQRVYELGVGPHPVPRKRLTIDNLSSAIRSAITDEKMREKASMLGERIRSEDGIARAVEILEHVN